MAIRVRALAAAIVGLIGTALYVGVIISQGESEVLVSVAWGAVMGGASLFALAGALVASGVLARRLLIGSTIVYALLGFLALFTIGLVFVVAAGLSGWAAASVDRSET